MSAAFFSLNPPKFEILSSTRRTHIYNVTGAGRNYLNRLSEPFVVPYDVLIIAIVSALKCSDPRHF